MSTPSDSADPPQAPAPRPRKTLGPAFWAGILFGLVCVFLGAVVGIWGSRILPPATETPPAAQGQPGPAPADHGPSPAFEEPSLGAAPGNAAPDVVEGGGLAFDPASDTYELEQRLAQVQAESRELSEAARTALAVSALTQAAERSAAFAALVDAHRPVLPDSADTEVLRELAAQGAPTRATLTADFPRVAARTAAAVRQAEPSPGVLARLARMLGDVVRVRRTDRLTGPSADAVLARAEQAIDRGDLPGAVSEVATLPPSALPEIGAWRAGAERRLAIEQRLSALRIDALARLDAQGSGG